MRGVEFAWDAKRPRALIMGIVNVTPDSFADGGRYLDPAAAVRQARALAAEGADLLDVGAESTRPGSPGVPADEERARLLPVLEQLLRDSPCPVSVDTSKPEVAEAALALGAHMVNDVTGLAGGPELARVCAAHGAGLTVMHMRGTPRTMQADPRYDDLLGEVRAGLETAVATAEKAGVAPESLCVDPGIGFGKTVAHNLTLLKRLDALRPDREADPGRTVTEELHRCAPRPPAAGRASRRDAGGLRHGRDGGCAHRAGPRRRRRAAGGPGGRSHPRRRAGMSGS